MWVAAYVKKSYTNVKSLTQAEAGKQLGKLFLAGGLEAFRVPGNPELVLLYCFLP